MRRTISPLVAGALLVLSVMTPAGAASGTACTGGVVQGLASATMAVGKQSFRGHGGTLGSASSWACQFRFYDDNEDPDNPSVVDNPEIPHVFKTTDWFLGGLFLWFSRADMEELGVDRFGAEAYLDAIVDHLYWRQQDGDWVDLPLKETAYHARRAPWGEMISVLHHKHHIFPAGSLAPGIYEFHWTQYDPGWDPPFYEAYGEVHIVN